MTQYYSRVDYNYAGDSNFTIPFSYIDKTDIHVYINDTLISTWTWLNDSQINISSTLSTGDTISIRRITPIDEKIVTYQNMSMVLNDDNLNLSQDQILDAVQEMYDNNVTFQIDVNAQIDEIDSKVDTANTTANQALSNSETAISTANTALSNSQSAVSTANAASTAADNAVSTANTASTNASNAVSTANSAASAAATAVSTANSAASDASEALSRANTAISTANTAKSTADTAKNTADTALADSATAVSNSETAISTANSAASDAADAVSTANAASADAADAVTTANSASSAASTAVSTANSASTAASNAVSTANTASTNATTAINKADEAIAIAQTAVSQGITPATTSQLGGIIVGTNLSITAEGVLSADAQSITVDNALSTTSENPVQNKVINSALNDKQDALTAGTDLEIVTAQAVRLPQGYTELRYVQSDGDCYIDTGIVSNLTDTVEQKFQKVGTDTTTCSWFGSMESTSLTRLSIGSYYRSNDSKAVFMCGANYTQSLGDMDTNPHVVKLYYNNGAYYSELDGNVDAYTPQSPSNQPTINAWLFARHGANGVNTIYDNEGTKIFYHKQKRANGTSILNLVPAKRDSDDEIGFYDLVSNTFRTNSGTGTLTGGEEVVFTNTTMINFTNDSGYAKTSDLATVATSGSFSDLSNVPNLATVATSGSYNDLTNKPTIPTVGNGKLTLTQGGEELGYATMNQSGDTTINIPAVSNRNIGEIISSTLPLNDAGLHLLDGTLLSGSGIYADFVDWIATHCTTVNADKVGSLIDRDNVLSNFSTTSYATKTTSYNLGTSTYWEFITEFTTGDNTGTEYIIGDKDSNTNSIKFWLVNGNISYTIGSVNSSTSYALDANTTYKLRIMNQYNLDYSYRGQYAYIYILDENDTLVYDITTHVTITSGALLCAFGVNYSSGSYVNPFSGSINFNNTYLNQIGLIDEGTMEGEPYRVWDGIKTLDCFTTEAAWQSAVTNNGVCGKFVYDSVNNTVRLPKITGIIEGTTNLSALGDLVAAGLPNITGSFYTSILSGTGSGNYWALPATNSGAFTNMSSTVVTRPYYSSAGTSTATWNYGSRLNASLSSPVYGNSSKVQPQTIKVLYYIVVATTTKTEVQVDIDNITTDLNSKVDKAGDTMTGMLSFAKSDNTAIQYKNTGYTLGATQSARTNLCSLYCNDASNTITSIIQTYAEASGMTGIQFAVRKHDKSGYNTAYLSTDSSGNAYFYFPKCTTAATTTSTAGDAKVAVVVQNYKNGKSWYRKWSDGWIEQGGFKDMANGENTITLLQNFTDTNYNVQVSLYYTSGTGTYNVTIKSVTTSNFKAYSSNTNHDMYWYACGY